MARIAKTAFEVSVSNITRNSTQNVPGYFGTVSGDDYTPDICASGLLCVKHALAPNDGYQGYGANDVDILNTEIMNGNTWQFVAATNGVAGNGQGKPGDHTGIYAFNSYGVNQVSDGMGHVWNIGANTLGLELPAGERGDFTELIVGEQYTFGEGNFTTLPAADTDIYATIANGQLAATATQPSTAGQVYLRIWRMKGFTVGARSAGFNGYVCECCRVA